MVLECREGDPVADPYDDAQYAAAAMNDLPALLDTLERYEKALESIFEHHIVWPTHDSQTLVKFAREALNPKEGG
jgi:hypothetical protein